MINRLRLGLPLKFVLSISIVIILTSLSLTWFFINTMVDQIQNSLEQRCTLLARNLAINSEFGVMAGNRDFLRRFNEIIMRENDVIYSMVYDKNGKVLALSENPRSFNVHKDIEPLLSFKMTAAAKRGAYENQGSEEIIKLSYKSRYNEPVHDTTLPIIIDRAFSNNGERVSAGGSNSSARLELVGFARVGISLSRMQKQISNIRIGVAILTSIVVAFGILLSIFLVRIIVKPIRQLSLGTKKIASGDLNYHVYVYSNDEIGDLADSFNQMAGDIRNYVSQLNREKEGLLSLKGDLETRTRELEETLVKMKNIQQELLRSEKFATIGRLSSSIAHELRNPLASMKNISYYLQKLGSFKDNPKAEQMLEILSSDVSRANKIVTDLMDFSKIRKLNKVPVKIDEFINGFLDSMDFGSDIRIIRELADVEASIDPDRMTQVLVNIFSNSRDAMPEGGDIVIAVSNKDARNVSIKISDNGHGMDTDTLEHVFDPLFSTKTRGLGLSLAIVKEVVDLHSGRISVTSKRGAGTTFEMLLPLQ